MNDWNAPATQAEMIIFLESNRVRFAEYAAQTAIPTQLWPNER